MLKNRYSTDLALLLVAFIWGSTYLSAKTALMAFPIALLLMLRFGIASLTLLPILVKKGVPTPKKPAVILGLLLTTSLLLETTGLALTSPANAGILIATSIVMIPLLERLSDPQSIPLSAIIPATMSLLGCGLMSLTEDLNFNKGDALILAAAVVRSIHLIASRHIGKHHHGSASAVNLVQFVTVAATSAVVAISRGELTSSTLLGASLEAWAVVFYLAIVCTAFAFVLTQRVVEQTTASRTSLLLGTEPVWAAAIAITIGGAHLTPRQWIGALLVIAAAEWGRQLFTAKKV